MTAEPSSADNTVEDVPLSVPVMKKDPWRFFVAAVFCLLSVSNAMQWITFAAIFDETREYFSMTAVQVNYLATTYVIAYVVAVFLSCKLFEVTGLKIGIFIAASANVIGASFKLLALYAWPNMALLYVAQVFNSITEILTIATPPLVANRWFPANERVVASTVMCIALNVGCGLGALLPVFFVTPEKKEKRHFGALFWFQFSLCALSFALTFLIPPRPRYSPSYAADRQEKMDERRLKVLRDRRNTEAGVGKESFQQQGHCASSSEEPYDGYEDIVSEPTNIFSTLVDTFHALRANPSFGFLAIASAAELGLIWSIATVLPQCLLPFGVLESETGWISFLNLVLGGVIAPVVMHYVGHKCKHRRALLIISVILVLNVTALCLLFHFGPAGNENRKYFVITAFVLWGGVAGLCQNFMLPIMFEFVVELTFPLRESTSAPVLTWTACLSNLILTIIFGEVLGNDPSRGDAMKVFLGTAVTCVIGFIALLLTRSASRREKFEAQMNDRYRALTHSARVEPAPPIASTA
uniref:Major facilitator superfamily (MFS) profile domain-containing protein n=1 Tax=Trypanosoma congolense (strain IL3000) TaxID=1068625 RepID=G0UVV2_TRYCI|nr:conserved hypothetical protein [Trypanosoma congolense IL3000]